MGFKNGVAKKHGGMAQRVGGERSQICECKEGFSYRLNRSRLL